MKLLLLLSLLISTYAFSSGGNCKVTIDSDDIELKWTGYKFPGEDKKGVSGTLRNLGVEDSYSGESLEAILKGLKFNIDSRSVWSRNSMRDARLVKFFFGKMVTTMIKGNIVDLKGDKLIVKLNMNGLTKNIELKVTRKGKRFKAIGVIDILDFGMNKSLAAINKECFDLHKGKTWSDVEVQLLLSHGKDC